MPFCRSGNTHAELERHGESQGHFRQPLDPERRRRVVPNLAFGGTREGGFQHHAPAVLAEDPARKPAPQRERLRPRRGDIEALAKWKPKPRTWRSPSRPPACCCRTSPACPRRRPRRHARRDEALGGDPAKINPLQPVELVIDHSVQVDEFGTPPRLAAQRRARVRAQPGALRVPPLGPEGASTTSRSCRRAPASCTR